MKTVDFNYDLPQRLIAQFPSEKRDDCRLLHLVRSRQSIDHLQFGDLPGLLKPGDHLVFNDTKVLPARVICHKETGGTVELLFTEYVTDRSWKALVKPAKRVKNEMGLIAEGGKLSAGFTIKERLPDATWLVSLESPEGVTIEDVLWQLGRVPLPHYIKRAPTQSDSKTYQTIFAKNPGAIASPTASLHFTEDLIRRLEASGVAISFVTLHVGIGTFKPVKESDPNNHMMHEERYALSEETTANLARTKKAGGRIIAVGTTVVRVLEHCSQTGCLAASSGATRLMIMPGYSFKAVDGMITNFHVPQSTLLMLVCAFAGKDFILTAYREAIEREYRFFSYGDAMIIL